MSRFLVFFVAGGLLAQNFAESAGTYVESWARDGLFRGAVLVAKGDQVIFRKGYGMANSEWEIPNTPETRFRLGSITKQFTAAGILQLAEAGKLSLDDPISKYDAGAPAAWEKVTIYHLLTHTSGIPSYTGLPDFFTTAKSRTKMTPVEIIGLTRDMPLEFAPGEGMKYDNTGYIILGYIIEKVSGQTYADYLQKHVFGPLHMADSGYDESEKILQRRASGYSRNGQNAPFLDMSLPYAAGSLYSTLDDLLKWNLALEGEAVLKPESKAKMVTPFKNNYAFGLVIGKIAGHDVVHHGGGINGFNTHLMHFPAEHVTVVTLTNQEGPGADRVADGLSRLYFGESVAPRPLRTEIKLPAEKLDALAGEYQLNPNMVLKIWREGDHLITQATGQGQLPVIALSETRLYARQPDAELEFQLDDHGKAKSLTLHQNGQNIPAPRLSQAK